MHRTLLALVPFLLVSAPAHAYIDGATGSMILQAALASLFAAAFTVKIYWRRLRGWVKGEKPSSELESAGHDR